MKSQEFSSPNTANIRCVSFSQVLEERAQEKKEIPFQLHDIKLDIKIDLPENGQNENVVADQRRQLIDAFAEEETRME